MEGIDTSGGNITLHPNGTGENFDYMWLANTEGGYVSKYDTRTGEEKARYLVIYPRGCRPGSGAGCTTQDNGLVDAGGPIGRDGLAGLQPSRTAIDYNGDAWVGNRSVINVGQAGSGVKHASVTKIANHTSRCRNGAHAKTSEDTNGNGVIDDDEWYHPGHPDWQGWDNLASYDDCVLFTTPVCNSIGQPTASHENAGVRALAVAQGSASGGDAWAGCWSDSTLVRLNGDTGRTMNTAQLDIRPYGAIADQSGRVWAVQKEAVGMIYVNNGQPSHQTANFYFALQSVNANTNDVSALVAPSAGSDAYAWCSAYGIGIDGSGRIWLGGRFTEGIQICRYDPRDNTWWHWGMSAEPHTNTGEPFGSARGIAVDTRGWVYFSGNGIGRSVGGVGGNFDATHWPLTRSQLMVIDSNNPNDPIIPFDLDGTGQNLVRAYDDSNETGAIGVGIDTGNNVWMVNHTGTAVQFRPDHDARVVRLGLNTRQVFDTANPRPSPNGLASGLYTYSDFTGYQLRNYASQGHFTRYFEACPNITGRPVWYGLVWKGRVASEDAIRVEVRFGSSKATLGPGSFPPAESIQWENAQWFSIDFGAQLSNGMEVTFHLTAVEGQPPPVLEDFMVYSECGGNLG